MTEIWVMKVVMDAPIDKIEHMADIITGNVTTCYLKAFDPNGRNGLGKIDFTEKRIEARHFDSILAVMECWKTQSTTVPLRPDGKPNRPLTAYTIQPERIDQ